VSGCIAFFWFGMFEAAAGPVLAVNSEVAVTTAAAPEAVDSD
jgi:hypothetical protein